MGAGAPNVAVFSRSKSQASAAQGSAQGMLMGMAMDQVHEGYLKASLGAGLGQLRFLQIEVIYGDGDDGYGL